MAKKKFLNENGEQIWPITRADCVYTEDGEKLLSEDYASKKYVDDAIAENGFSGDYNDLENKPCYETTALMRKTFNIDTTTATEQVQAQGSPYCYINDLPLPFDITESMDLTYTHATKGGNYTINGKVPRKLTEDLYSLDSNTGYPLVFIVLKEGASYSGISGALHKGIYAAKSAYGSERVTSLTYSVLGGEIKQLDEKFIPDTIARVSDLEQAIEENGFSGDYNDLENKPTIPSIEGLATEDYVDNEITKLRDEMIVLEEDDLSIDGLIDSTFPSLATEDKTLIGAINEVNENIQNIKPTEEEIEKAVIDKILMDVFGVVVDEEAN